MADRRAESKALSAHRVDLNRQLRLAFLTGAEERSRESTGRGLMADELERVLRRYPGDQPER